MRECLMKFICNVNIDLEIILQELGIGTYILCKMMDEVLKK